MKKTAFLTGIIGLFFISASGQVPNSGLVGYWPFRGNADDLSGNGNNGTVNEAALATDRFGLVNQAYFFDGVNDYIRIGQPIPAILQMQAALSISVWVKPAPELPTGELGGIVASQWDPASSGYSVQMEYRNNIHGGVQKGIHFQAGTGSVYWTNDVQGSTSAVLNLDEWNHVVAIAEPNSKYQVYMNGKLVTNWVAGSSIQYNDNCDLLIGYNKHLGGSNRYFAGLIDDICVYNRVLTESEIDSLLRQGSGPLGISVTNDTLCIGESASIRIVNPQPFTRYQLIRASDMSAVGLADTAGFETLLTLQTGALTTTMDFRIQARDTATGHTTLLDTTVHVVMATPSAYSLEGPDEYCKGTPADLTLSGSQPGVHYQLIKDGQNFGAPVPGNGPALRWDDLTNGTYWVYAETDAYSCSRYMIDTISIVENPTFVASSDITLCQGDSYSWRGDAYSITGVYYDSLQTFRGCDSVFILNLNVNPAYSFDLFDNICEGGSYSWRGSVYTSAGTYYNHLYTQNGCDSVYILHLTVSSAVTSSITVDACNIYKAPDGAIYTQSGVKTAVIPTSAGCDSIITIYLTVKIIDATVTVNDPVITANATGAAYQWIDGITGTLLAGEVNRTFAPAVNGTYAVIVTQNGCTDTSQNVTISGVTYIENSFRNILAVFPNPTTGKVTIDLGAVYRNIKYAVLNANGKILQQLVLEDGRRLELTLDDPPGIYFIRIEAGDERAIIKIIKNL